jgi:hypothetical protein
MTLEVEPEEPERAGRAGQLIQRHWGFAAVLAAGVALRIVTSLAYWPALLYVDSPKYLSGADGGDPVGYRVLLLPLNKLGGLGLVAVVQHLIGLGLGVALYVMLVRRGVPRWLAVIAAAPVLLDAYQLQIEQMILPDLMFEAMIAVGIILLAWSPRPSLWAILAGAVVLGGSVDVRQVGEILIVPLVVFVAMSVSGWKPRIVSTVAAVVAFGIPVLAYMSINAHETGHFAITTNPPNLLYGRAAYAADCQTLVLPSYERVLCPSQALINTVGGIDGLIHDYRAPGATYKPPKGMTITQVESDFAKRVIRQQPARFGASVARDTVRLFALTRDGVAVAETPLSRWQFQPKFPTYGHGIVLRTINKYVGPVPAGNKPLDNFLRDYQLYGGYTPGPLYLIGLLLGVIGSCLAFGRRSVVDRSLGVMCLLVTLTAVAVLGLSDLFEFSWRYQIPAAVTIVPAGAVGAAMIAVRLRASTWRPRLWRTRALLISGGAGFCRSSAPGGRTVRRGDGPGRPVSSAFSPVPFGFSRRRLRSQEIRRSQPHPSSFAGGASLRVGEYPHGVYGCAYRYRVGVSIAEGAMR